MDRDPSTVAVMTEAGGDFCVWWLSSGEGSAQTIRDGIPTRGEAWRTAHAAVAGDYAGCVLADWTVRQ